MGSSSSKNNKKTERKDQKTVNQPTKFSREWEMRVLNQKLNSVCQIITKEGKTTGFLCKIPDPVLITSNQIFNADQIKSRSEIKIIFTDEKNKKHSKTIKITEKRTTITVITKDEEEIGTTIIEIKPDEDQLEGKEFIEIDKNLMNDDSKKNYETKNCYLITYKKGENLITSLGKITEVKQSNESFILYHNCDSEENSSGAPIILYNNKVIGVSGKYVKNGKFNRASLLKYPIQEYLKKLSSKKNIDGKSLKPQTEKEEINILEPKIDKEELQTDNPGKLVSNILESKVNKKETKKLPDDSQKLINNKLEQNAKKEEQLKFSEVNERLNDDKLESKISKDEIKSNTPNKLNTDYQLKAGNLETKIQNHEENGIITMIYNIRFKSEIGLFGENFVNSNKDKCKMIIRGKKYEIKKIIKEEELSEYGIYKDEERLEVILEGKRIKDMSFMFYECTKLLKVDFSSFNAENVVGMRFMFFNCFSLKKLDLSSFITQKVTDMSYTFEYCSSLNKLDLTPFYAGNVKLMQEILYDNSVFRDRFTKITIKRKNFKKSYFLKKLLEYRGIKLVIIEV